MLRSAKIRAPSCSTSTIYVSRTPPLLFLPLCAVLVWYVCDGNIRSYVHCCIFNARFLLSRMSVHTALNSCVYAWAHALHECLCMPNIMDFAVQHGAANESESMRVCCVCCIGFHTHVLNTFQGINRFAYTFWIVVLWAVWILIHTIEFRGRDALIKNVHLAELSEF